MRALQPRELFKTQQYATAVYRSELASRLSALGYDIERGTSGQPEIRGYTEAYLEASSQRRQQIEAHLQDAQRIGAAAAQIAALQTREPKLDVAHDEMHQRHRALAEAFGNQPAQVVQAAQDRTHLWSASPHRSRRTLRSRSRKNHRSTIMATLHRTQPNVRSVRLLVSRQVQ